MLVELHIRDFALIDELDLAFGPGLNAITGETGSGKSLLVTALEVLLGQRPRGGPRGWVREGAKRARVEGRFSLLSGPLAARVGEWLARELPELHEEQQEEEGEGELVLSRTIGADGRTKAYVNHRPVTRRALAGLAELLFEIHGQNDHQKLVDPAEQRRLVDAMGEHGELLERYRGLREGWRRALERRRAIEESSAARERRIADLRFEVGELQDAELFVGEREALTDERGVLRSADDLARELAGVLDALSEADGSALERLRSAERVLDRWSASVGRLNEPTSSARDALAHLEDATRALQSFVDGVEANPARLEEVEARLAELDRLERKYGLDEEELVPLADTLEQELAELEGAETSRETLDEEVALLAGKTERAAKALTKARRKLAPRLVASARAALADLGMEAAELELEVRPRAEGDELARFGTDGADDVELLLAANPGEPKKPLRHVASGGEAARIMLALRSVLSVGPAPAGRGERTLVFDEIDSGVGGHVAPKVAGHLRTLAAGDQVLTVTHLPAIAAAADHHLRVSKERSGGRSRTVVTDLGGDERVAEVADMIAGGAGHATARAEARRLLER